MSRKDDSPQQVAPTAWMWKMHGWTVTAHGKHRAIKRHVDLCRPPESTVASGDFIRLVPLYAVPPDAQAVIDGLRTSNDELRDRKNSIAALMQQRDQLAGLLREIRDSGRYASIPDDITDRIDSALAELPK